MKRILALSLSAALLLAMLCACTSADPGTTVIPPDLSGESASVPPTSTPSPEPSEQPSAEPTEEATDGPTAEPPSTDNPTHHPEESHNADPTHHPEESHHAEPTHHPEPTRTPEPTSPPTPEPSAEPSKAPDGFTEPTGPSASDVNLTDFYQIVLNSYGFPPMEIYPNEFAANFYPGLFTIPVVQRVVGAPMMTGVAAELTLVQVTNSSDVSAVKSILQARVDRQANDFNYPQVTEAWKNNSRIVSNGNYVMLVVHSECDAIVAQFNALF